MNVDNLTLKEKIGQMLMFGVKSKNIDCLCHLISECKIGGVVLYKDNYNNYDEMIDVINRLKMANKNNKIPLFIAIDQEGGRVNRMPNEFSNIKNVFDLTLKNDISIIEDASKITSLMLLSNGINMNFSPVLDIYNNSKNNVLYKRCFGSDIQIVSKYGVAYMKKMNEMGVISVVKHFPGHGSSKVDSHIFLPYVFNYKDILNKHIIPFEDAINNGCDAIMVSHLIVRKLTNGVPASISKKFINNYLRIKYNYDGLLISDDIRMKAVDLFYGNNSLKLALKSGIDIILLKYNDGDYYIIDKISKLLINDDNLINSINKSVNRILYIKEKYKVNDNFIEKGDIDLINLKISKLLDK